MLAGIAGWIARHAALEPTTVLCGNHRISLADLYAAGTADAHCFIARRRAYLAPRSVAFSVHGIRLAVQSLAGA
jgi:putative selenate reductase molybdopterin-binding subunit